jgi:hypothetical protein
MWLFKEKTDLKTYEERIKTLELKVFKLESEVLSTILDQKIMRDKVLRKIQFKRPEEEEEKTEESKDLYNGVLVKAR